MAIQVGGTSSDYLNRDTNLPPITSFTLMYWVATVANAAFDTFFQFGDSTSDADYQILLDAGGTQLHWWNGTASAGSSDVITVGVWNHIAITVAGTGANQFLIYFNGALVGTANGNASNTQERIYIGKDESTEALSSKFAYWGEWNRPLERHEILAQMYCSRPVVGAGFLNGWWPFDKKGDLTDFVNGGKTWTSNGTVTTAADGPPLVKKEIARRRTYWFYPDQTVGGTTHTKSYSENLAVQESALARLANAFRNYTGESVGWQATTFIRLANAFRNYTDTTGNQESYVRQANAFRNYTSESVGLTTVSPGHLILSYRGFTENAASQDATFSRLANAFRVYLELAAIQENISRIANAFRSYSDTTPAVAENSPPHYLVPQRNLSDSTGYQDSTYVRLANTFRNYQDLAAAAEAFTIVLISAGLFQISFTESVAHVDQTYTRLANAFRTYAESLAQQDSFYLRLANASRQYTENSGCQEAFSRISNAFRNYIDSLAIGLEEFLVSIIGSGVYTRSLSDDLAVQEVSLLRIQNVFRNYIESTAVSETLQRIQQTLRSYAESLATSEVYKKTLAYDRPVSDNLAFIDSQLLRTAHAFRTLAENVGWTESISRLANAFRTYADNLAVADLITVLLVGQGIHAKTYTDSTAVIESSYTRLANGLRNYTTNLATSESLVRLCNGLRSYADSVACTEAYLVLIQSLRLLTENVGHTETYQRLANAFRIYLETTGLAEQFTSLVVGLGIYAFNIVDQTGLAEGAYSRLANSLRTYLEQAGYAETYGRAVDLYRYFSQELGATEGAIVRLADSLRIWTESFTLSDTLPLTTEVVIFVLVAGTVTAADIHIPGPTAGSGSEGPGPTAGGVYP